MKNDFDSGYSKSESDNALDKIIADINSHEENLQKKASETIEYILKSDERLHRIHAQSIAHLDKAIAMLRQITSSIEADRQERIDSELCIVCPKCGEVLDFEPPYPAEPDTNTAAWDGGYLCECGFIGGEGWEEQ